MKGGKREGAGRPVGSVKPKNPETQTKPAMIRLTEVQRLKFLELGGAQWMRRLIDEAISAGAIKHGD